MYVAVLCKIKSAFISSTIISGDTLPCNRSKMYSEGLVPTIPGRGEMWEF